MKGTWIRAALAVAAMTTIVACGDDDGDGGDVDGGRDAGRDSGMMVDGGPDEDAGGDPDDGGGMDGGDTDGGDSDGGGSDGGTTDGGGSDGGSDAGLEPPELTSAQIAAVRAAAAGTVDLPIDEAVVTYLKPAIGMDPAGFFVQAEPDGPALFVAVVPATLTPAPEVGDVVSFRVTSIAPLAMAQGRRQVTAISGWTRDDTDFDVESLTVDRSAATDLVSALDDYESELIVLSGTIAGTFAASGGGFTAAPIDTVGVTGNTSLLLRMPTTLRDELDAAEGCDFTATAPMWRFTSGATNRAQLSISRDTEIVLSGCPAPIVVSAAATDATTVTVTFDRNIDPASITDAATQFTLSGGATVSAATVAGRDVTLTTSTLTSGTTYTVTVAATVTDEAGTGVDAANDTADFTFGVASCRLVINEVQTGGTSASDEFIELYNPCATSVDLMGYRVVYRSESGTTNLLVAMFGAISIAANGYIVLGTTAFVSAGGTRDVSFSQGLAAGGGGLALLDTADVRVDSVAWGSATNEFREGAMTAPAPAARSSIGRSPNGRDTDSNGTDFVVFATPTPGAAN